MNQVKTRLQSLGLLDRAFGNIPDDALDAAISALNEERREAIDELIESGASLASVRSAIVTGRLDGTMEGIALVLTNACLEDCVEQLGEHSDNPTSDQLREVNPGLIERHGLTITQLMYASTIVGEAPASAIIRDLLKHDDVIKMAPAEPKPLTPRYKASVVGDDERAAVKEKRNAQKTKKQDAARASREQAARARNRL